MPAWETGRNFARIAIRRLPGVQNVQSSIGAGGRAHAPNSEVQRPLSAMKRKTVGTRAVEGV